MFAAQLAAAVLVWSGLVYALFRRRLAIVATMRPLSRGSRGRQAILRLFGSLLAIGLAMTTLAQGGLKPSGFTPIGWLSTTALGGLFIFLQTTALVPLVLNAVTPQDSEPSNNVDVDRP